MSDVLTDTLTVRVGDDDFVFRIPTPIQQIQMGIRGLALRRRFDPMGAGWETGLDDPTYMLIRGMVLLEVLLKQSSAKWVYSEAPGADGRPNVAVNIDSLPPHATPIIIQVYQGFTEALATFFAGGTGDNQQSSPAPVAG